MRSGEKKPDLDSDLSKRLLGGRPLSRRQFLKTAGVAGAAIGLGTGVGGLLAGCGDGGSSGTTGASGDVIKIGIMGPMADPTGMNVLRPAEMMIKKINAAGGIIGKQIEIVGPIDDHWETAQAITAYETLLKEGVHVILSGSDDNVESALLSRIGQNPDVLYLSMFASTQGHMVNVRDDYEKFKGYFMFTAIDDGLYYCVEEPAIMLKEKFGWNKAYMIREDMVWTEGIEQYFKDSAPQKGFEIVGIDVVPLDVEDLTPYFRNAEKAGAQMIWTMISVFGEKLANQAWDSKVPIAMFGHNGILNDYGYWERSNGAWGPMATTSTWGSLEKHSPEWRDFLTEWFTTYSDDPRTPMWLGECTWRGIKAYQEAVERAGTIETDAVIKELEMTYYPDAPVAGGFYGPGEGIWPHTWAMPIDEAERAKADPTRGEGLWMSSTLNPMTQWQPKEIAPADSFVLPGTPDDYGRLVTIWPPALAGGEYQLPPFFPESPNA